MPRTSTRTNVLLALALVLSASRIAEAQTTPATDDTAWLSTFRLQTTLPYGLMDEFPGGLPLAIENERILGAVTEQLPLGFLRAHLRLQTDSGAPDPRPTPNITMKSEIASFPPDILATLRFQRGAKRFESPWIVLLADPRASIRWTPAIPNKAAVGCVPCERPPHVVGKTEANGVYEVWAHGRLLTARPGGSITGNYAYLGEQGRMASRVNAIVADTVRVADQGLASKTPPMFGALRVQGVLVHSGELVREAVDLAVKGRGLDFVLQRHYSSAVYSFGSLGRNFDSPLFARIRWLPDGSFDFFDGTGRVDHFTRKANQFVPPIGVFLHANGSGDGGVILRYLDNTALFFDGYGRLVRITDRNVTTIDASDGNVVHLTYNAQGRLASVVDPTARSIKFAYYGPAAPATNGVFPGLLASVTDFGGRTVRYEYDTYGRLTKVVGPDPQSTSSAQQVTTYTWGPPPTSGNFRLDVLRSGQILSERDALGRTIYSATFNSDLPWRIDTLATGGGTWTYGYAATATTVTDPNLHARRYSFDANGRITTIDEPGDAITTFAFDGAGRLTSVTRPLGDQTILDYGSAASNGDRRPMANVQSIIEVPRAGSPERAANITRTIAIEYGPANLPVKITSPRGVTTIHRDARGNPTSVTDPSNVASTFVFDPHGQLLSLADPRAGTNTFAYHEGTTLKSGYLKSVTTATGIATYEVDNRGNLVKVTQPGGSAATYTVNDLDQVERENAGVALREQSFDAAGNLSSRRVLAGTAPDGTPLLSTTTLAIDEIGRLKSSTENGVATAYSYDPASNLKQIARPATAAVTYGYDARDRLVTYAEGAQTTQVGYDENSTLVSTTNPRGRTTTYTPGGFGEKAQEKDPLGIVTAETLDALGRAIDTRIVKSLPAGDLLLRWTTREYDAQSRVTKETAKLFPAPLAIPASGDPAGATDVVTRFEYDDANRRITTIDPLGIESIVEHDELGRIVRTVDGAGNEMLTRYDGNGNRAEETIIEKRPDGETETFRTHYQHDGDDRLVRVMDMSDPARPRTIEYRYDARGNRTEEIDADGRTRKFEYDLRGNRVKQIDPEGGATAFRYDDANLLILLRDPNGGEIAWTYDMHGNLLTEKRSDGAMWTHTYDENDNRTTTSDPNGALTTILYDDVDRLVARQIAKAAGTRGPASIAYVLDDLGRTTRSETDEGVKTFASYDSLDRELAEELQIGSGPKRTIAKQYDIAGNLIGLTYPSGLALEQSIDPLGRIASIGERHAATPLVTYSDVGARLFGTTLANGISHAFTYDANRRLDRILAAHRAAEAPPLFDVQYDWTTGGAKESVRRADLGKRWTYERNRNGWITAETARRESRVNSLERSTEYEIDPALNYRAIHDIVQTPETSVRNDVTTTINARHQYTTFGESRLAYDRNGNLTQTPVVQLAYDSENRLTRATLADGTVIDHLYDAFGRKVRQTATVAGTTTTREYVLSGDAVIEEYADGALAMRYVRGRGIDEVVRSDRGTRPDGSLDTPLFAHQDELGNVLALTDLGGNLFERYEYDGYGKFRIFTPVSPDPVTNSPAGWRWLFQGREYDPLLGAYDFRARTLWPELGRFGQEDPLGPGDSPNLYQAFLGDWTMNTDPFGLEILPGEIVGPSPYNLVTGGQAHREWEGWIRQNRQTEMGREGRAAFYNRTLDTILGVARGKGTRAKKNGNKKPDAARIERTKNVTVWELKPRSYDPAFGAGVRAFLAERQLNMYTEGLGASQRGRGAELHPRFTDRIGEIASGDRAYVMYAYLGGGQSRGLIYYRLEPLKREGQRDLVKETLAYAARNAPCVAQYVGAGVLVGGVSVGAAGAAVGAAGGTLVVPGVGTLVGAAGVGVAGVVAGGIGGGSIGLGQGLLACGD